MTLTITHNKVATLPDQPGAEVNKAEWNDTHAIGGDLTGYTITTSQISDAAITAGSSVSGSNTGDQNLSPYATLASPIFTGTVGGITAAMVGAPSGSGTSSGSNTGDQTNISGNAETVTTNANLTGPITSSGNATSITAQTGTGTKFVVDTSPSLITPAIGVATGTGLILTGTSANIFAAGANGSTNPAFTVDASASSAVTGIRVVSSAHFLSGPLLTVTSDQLNEPLRISPKGDANLTFNTGGTNGELFLQVNGSNRIECQLNFTKFTTSQTSGAGTAPRFEFDGQSDTGLTAGTEATEFYTNFGQTRQHASNTTISTQRDFRITGSMHSFATAGGTITNAAAFSIDNFAQAGTNATITNGSGLYIPSQAVAGTVTNAYGINVVAPTGAGTLNQAALFTGDVAITSGNLLVNTAGKGLSIKSGSNARIGTGTLTAGTVTIANTSVTANTRVFLQDTTSGGLTNVGVLTAVTTAGTGFVVTSTLALDTSTFNWMLVESS